ncbi:hypothetical protein PAMA_009679 [Pampus argenteus]
MRCGRRMMMNVSTQLCLLAWLTVGLTLALGSNQDMGFTFLLPAGSTECFYQTTARNDSMEVEYQVIAGSGLDVGFVLISPSGHRLASDFRRSDGIHMVDPTDDGDYRLCFDNSFSKLSEKMVFFDVNINSQSSTGGGRDEWADVAVTETMAEYKLKDIRVRAASAAAESPFRQHSNHLMSFFLISRHPNISPSSPPVRCFFSSSPSQGWILCTSAWRGVVRCRPH